MTDDKLKPFKQEGRGRFEPNPVFGAIITAPEPKDIAAMRVYLGLKQSEVAQLLQLSSRQLISSYEQGARAPSPQTWTLYLLLTNQHPDFKICQR